MSMRALYTIGYEGCSIAEFLATLETAGVQLLIDVRDVPISRKPGFSKNALSVALSATGIDDLHLKGLGDPKPGRIAAREGRFDDFQRIFDAHLKSPKAQLDMAIGVEFAANQKACLVCFERDHSQCHRRIVAHEMADRGKFRLVHLAVPLRLTKKFEKRYDRTEFGAISSIG